LSGAQVDNALPGTYRAGLRRDPYRGPV